MILVHQVRVVGKLKMKMVFCEWCIALPFILLACAMYTFVPFHQYCATPLESVNSPVEDFGKVCYRWCLNFHMHTYAV